MHPLDKKPPWFCHPASVKLCVSISAVIFGFFVLSRFHVLEKMNIGSLSLVEKGGHEFKNHHFFLTNHKNVLFPQNIIGFYFLNSDKFQPEARVYLANIFDTLSKWWHIYLLRALRLPWAHNFLDAARFSKKRFVINKC